MRGGGNGSHPRGKLARRTRDTADGSDKLTSHQNRRTGCCREHGKLLDTEPHAVIHVHELVESTTSDLHK